MPLAPGGVELGGGGAESVLLLLLGSSARTLTNVDLLPVAPPLAIVWLLNIAPLVKRTVLQLLGDCFSMLDDPGIKLTTLGAAAVVKLAFMARAIIVESLCNAKGILGRNRKTLECNSSYYESSSILRLSWTPARASKVERNPSECKQRKVLQWLYY